MKQEAFLRTSDLARAVGKGVQQVRNYENWGLVPPAERAENGYRLYTPRHLSALQTACGLVGGYGWQLTQRIMQAVHQDQLTTALALVDGCHAGLHDRRLQVERTLVALRALSGQTLQEVAP